MRSSAWPIVFLVFMAFTWPDSQPLRKNQAFTQGEELTFTVKYLFFNAAEAKMIIHDRIHYIQEKPAYKIDVFGRTLSIFKLFYVKDNWGTYLDTAKIIPYRSYRHIEEGGYRKHEIIDFDHQNREAEVRLFDRENKELVETTQFDVPSNVQDIVSGYYLLRTMNLKGLKKGQAININGFFDKKNYNLKLIFEGKEKISTDIGEFNTFVFLPQMPKNKLFSGDYPIKVWITDDENRIPVKIKAKLVVGALNMDITEAQGLRNPPQRN
ncbi:DUF3108 domain-containing protein [Pleomorphovibrio marinus]|uniref:DUF3108 domain-containing protein n=1 Tax=Pleomorphovibrio marinus TaxID=2164132 RepID=UPI000E0A175A